MQIEKILEERQKTHGDFTENAEISQRLKYWVHPSAHRRTPVQNEALDMILHKISRICAGDPDHKDAWDDIAGYAKLVSDRLELSKFDYAGGAGDFVRAGSLPTTETKS